MLNASGGIVINSTVPPSTDAAVASLTSDINMSPLGAPFNTAGNNGSSTIARLREGIERFLITDINNPAGSAKAQSQVVMMWDIVNINPSGSGEYNHVPGGGNVLFMDGHVTFLKYEENGDFPINAPFARAVTWSAG
jgi:prepilin-type processing-associated H-X9-DG protein